MKDQLKNKNGSWINNMKKIQEEKKAINKFNKSKEGKILHNKINNLHKYYFND